MNDYYYMRKERLMYNYICEHVDSNNQMITTDQELATNLNILKQRAFNWRKLLEGIGVIECKSKYIDRQKKTIITLIEK